MVKVPSTSALFALWGFALLMVGSSVALSHAHTVWRILGVVAMMVGVAIFVVLSSATVREWWLRMRSRAHR